MSETTHPAVAELIRHTDAGYPLLAIPLLGMEQERFAAALGRAVKDDPEADIRPFWFDIARWPNLMDLTNSQLVSAEQENDDDSPFGPQQEPTGGDGVGSAIDWLVANANAHSGGPRFVLVMSNVQRMFAQDSAYAGNNVLCQKLRNAVSELEKVGFSLVFTGTSVPSNPTIDRILTVLNGDLPSEDEFMKLAADLREFANLPAVSEDNLHAVGKACLGMDYNSAKNVLSMLCAESSDEDTAFDIKTIIKKKKAIVESIPGLELFEPRDYDKPENLIGMRHAMKVVLAALTGKPRHPQARVKAFIFNGLPGTGKSDLCRKVAYATGRTVLRWNPKNSQGSLVGQSEENVQQVFRIAESIGAILIIDEMDSALSGSGAHDGGVMKGIIGAVQTFMQDTENCTIIGTTNDLSAVPGPIKRGGRVDEIFWFGYPSRDDIVRMFTEVWCPHYGYELEDGELDALNLDRWVGADVEAAVRKAVGRGQRLGEISIAPSYLVMGDSLRKWKEAAHGTVDADTGEIMVWDVKDLVPSAACGVVSEINPDESYDIHSNARAIKRPKKKFSKYSKSGKSSKPNNN